MHKSIAICYQYIQLPDERKKEQKKEKKRERKKERKKGNTNFRVTK